MIDAYHGDGGVGAHAFEGVGAFLFAGRVKKGKNV
jgi:hypothetical protein